jgi:putative membrane protein insertion efficiency factor
MMETAGLKPYQPSWWALLIIRAYQRWVSPLTGPNCRFHPTCSSYAAEAVATQGLVRGGWLSVKRIGRCHPFREGGYDPVPPHRSALEETF